mmetsp:Transcript_107956/g.301009  ORF Transcript_107956/g.301009 Transcript_107956/m.301009 type:complete len:270 (-) Transcript_107956:1756-2565(-)
MTVAVATRHGPRSPCLFASTTCTYFLGLCPISATAAMVVWSDVLSRSRAGLSWCARSMPGSEIARLTTSTMWFLQNVRLILSRSRSSNDSTLWTVSCKSTNSNPRTLARNTQSVTPCQPAISFEPGNIACSGLFSQRPLPARVTRLKTVPPSIRSFTMRSSVSADRRPERFATRPSKGTSKWSSNCTGLVATAWKTVNWACGASGPVSPLMGLAAFGSFAALWQQGMHLPLSSHDTAWPHSIQPRPTHRTWGNVFNFSSLAGVVPSRSR